MSSFGKCNVNTEDIWETKTPENGKSESGFIMSLFCLSYIINSKLGRAYAITNEIRDEFFLALENLSIFCNKNPIEKLATASIDKLK